MHLGAVLSRRCANSKYFILMNEWIHWFIIWLTAQCLPRVTCYGCYIHTIAVFIDSWVTWFDLVSVIVYSIGSINLVLKSRWSKIRTVFPFSFYFKLNAGKPLYETITMDKIDMCMNIHFNNALYIMKKLGYFSCMNRELWTSTTGRHILYVLEDQGTEVNKFGLRQVGVYKFWRLKGKTSVKYVSSLIMPMGLYVYLHEEYN